MANKFRYDGSDAVSRSFREDPLDPQELSRQATIDEITHNKLDELISAIAGDLNVINIYNEISSLASSTEATIVSYTVPADKEFNLFLIEAGGENIAKYQLKIQGLPISTRRTYFGDKLVTEFDLRPGLSLAPGTIITVSAIHQRPDAGDFEGRIMGVLK